mmetsp:Transcript_2109/g.3679  ORF Transcript_2109/g.3679 Transcript_2109/m.3679 type:complete len:401 (+) Transcript_2109:66-1268(+)
MEEVGITVLMLDSLKGATGNSSKILSLVRKAEQSHSGGELCAVYAAAIDAYSCPKATQDEEYRELCVKYMLELCYVDVNEAREFHNRQRAFGVTSDARMYAARASLEEREGDEKKAMKILQEGIRAGAQPAELLKKQMDRLQRQEKTFQQPKEDRAMQTEVGRSISTQTEGTLRKRSMASLAFFRRLERIQRNCCLFDVFGAWKDLRDAAVQRRQQALFESLREQLDMAKRKTLAADACLKSSGRNGPQVAWLPVSFRLWRSSMELSRQRQRLADAAFQEELRRRVFRVLLGWRSTCFSFRQTEERFPETPLEALEAAEPAVPILDSLLLDLAPGAQRSPLRSMESNVDPGSVEPKRLRPQRPYDTSGYTGCARYGGPKTAVEPRAKKENIAVCTARTRN